MKRNESKTKIINLELTKRDILTLLEKSGEIPSSKGIFFNVFINVPRGGDYSGMKLDIDEDMPIFVEIRSHE